MEKLYISDLDGTLLGADALLSRETVDGLNSLIEKGVNFSIATARTNATVVKMLSEVNIKLPVILMNGVTIYDIGKKEYVVTESISKKGRKHLFDVIKKHIGSGFVYCIDNNELATYYENASSPVARAFIEERERLYGKKFTRVKSFDECLEKNVVYYSIDAEEDNLRKAYEALSQCPDLHIEFYRDIYNTDHWYLEVCSHTASKKNAVKHLRTLLDAKKVISFGDNLNDIPMFEASDEAYAVANAKDEVKNTANGVIDSNINNGVVKFISSQLEK